MAILQIKWNDKQKQIFDAIGKEHYTKLFVHGGVRSGKSLAICYIIDLICRKTPNMTFLIGRKSFESLKTDTIQIFKKNPAILDKSKGEWKDGGRQFDYHNGSQIFFRHFDNPEALLGMTVGGIYIEQAEEIKKEDYQLVRTRLSQWGGKNVVTTQYLKHYRELIADGQLLKPQNYLFLTSNPKACWLKEEFISKIPEDGFKVIHLTTYDNLENLPESEISSSSAQSDAFKNRFYLGSWEFASGLIYPEFVDDNIVGDTFELLHDPSKKNDDESYTYKCLVGIDPGYATSKFSVLFSIILPDGSYYFFDEIVRNGKDAEEMEKIGVPEICNLIKEKLNRYKISPLFYIDYSANAKVGGLNSISEVFRKSGINVMNCNKGQEMDSIYKNKALLKAKKILVHPRCHVLVKEFGLWSWHPKLKDKPVNSDNDCLDAMKYIINSNLTPSFIPKTFEFTQEEVMKGFSKELFSESNNVNAATPAGGFKVNWTSDLN